MWPRWSLLIQSVRREELFFFVDMADKISLLLLLLLCRTRYAFQTRPGTYLEAGILSEAYLPLFHVNPQWQIGLEFLWSLNCCKMENLSFFSTLGNPLYLLQWSQKFKESITWILTMMILDIFTTLLPRECDWWWILWSSFWTCFLINSIQITDRTAFSSKIPFIAYGKWFVMNTENKLWKWSMYNSLHQMSRFAGSNKMYIKQYNVPNIFRY